MHLVTIAWLYVALMMAVAEGLHPQGGWLGAAITFVLYGVAPVSLVIYLLGTPARKARLREADRALERDDHGSARAAVAPDERGHASGAAIAPVRKEP